MKVKDIMSTKIASCGPSTSLREVAALMAEHDCGEIPVCDAARKPIGVVTDRDIVCRMVAKGKNPLEATAADCMSRSVVTATPNLDIEECARLMEQYQVRRLPVVDASGACCGIVAQADLATKGPRQTTAEVVSKVSQETARASAAHG